MHTNNRSTWPGAIIGYRKNGTPIRLIAGGAPDGDGDGAGDGQGDGAGTGDNGQGGNASGDGTGGQGAAGTGQQGSASAGTSPSDDSAARTIAAIRQDFKDERTKRQAAEKRLADLETARTKDAEDTKQRNLALAKALGLPGSEDPPDPEKLAAELAAERKARQDEITTRQTRERELTVELELLKQARKHGADPELLVDSRSFMQTLGKLDPASEDFATDLGDAIKSAVEKNPGYKLTTTTPPGTGNGDGGGSGPSNASGSGGNGDQGGSGDGQGGRPPRTRQGTTAPPARSGTGEGHNGAPGGNRQWTDDDVAKASPSEVAKAMEDGLLVGLGFNPPKKRR